MNFIIIGNGVAGIEAALALRQSQPQARITVISAETDYFFSRTALMYIAMGHMRLQDTEPYERVFYKKQKIDLINDSVTRIDTNAHKVILDKGFELSYDKLLIATGAQPALYGWPGIDLSGVVYFVSYQHLQQIQQLVPKAKRVVVVGGGLIGIELVEVFLHYGLEVDFLIKDDHFWASILNYDEGKYVEKHIQEFGVNVLLGQHLKKILGQNNKVSGIETEEGQKIECDLVALATGVRPNIELAQASGLKCQRGVITDWQLATSVPDVYAAGDCVEIAITGKGRNFIRTIWYSARDMGRIAAANMLGGTQEYDPDPWYNSAKFFHKEYTTVGQVGAQTKAQKDYLYQDERHSVRITHDNRQVLGFNMIGVRWQHEVLLKFIAQKCSLEYFLTNYQEALFEAEFSPVPKVAS
jgi:NAD(P)H-nitrite reductase large subunit